VRKINVTNNG
jgi:hypothetical protein